MKKPYDQPTRTDAVDGEVTLDGPDGVGLSMTPEAAEETSRRLKAAADEARRQPPASDETDGQDE